LRIFNFFMFMIIGHSITFPVPCLSTNRFRFGLVVQTLRLSFHELQCCIIFLTACLTRLFFKSIAEDVRKLPTVQRMQIQ